jgi:FAD/FMN-containing dehydrogenase
MSPSIDQLTRHVRGRVIVPSDDAYDETRRTFNAMLDRRPAVIVQPTSTADVVKSVTWAAEANLPISIRGGGHSVAGHSVGDGSLMIDLVNLRTVVVDRKARVAEVGGGAKLEHLDDATTKHDLVAPSGTYSDTGVGGLVLGGGLSYVLASRGLACDALVGAELVTADGTVVEVDEKREPELLWALRGGGGNFGVVTKLRMALTPLRDVYLGRMYFRGSGAAELLAAVFELDAAAPDELTTQAVLSQHPTEGPVVTIIAVWTGAEGGVGSMLEPFRRRPDLINDVSRATSYRELQLVFERMGPTYRHYWKGQFVSRADGGLIDAIVSAQDRLPTTEGLILVEPMHGMVHRIADETAAFGARRAVANVSALGVWTDPADDAANVAWARESVDGWAPWSLQGGGYVNYSPDDETATRVRQAYGDERFTRLQAVKQRTDPDNRFRFNANIPPAG